MIQASFLIQDKDLLSLHSQYYGCWCPGNARRFSNHDINQVELCPHMLSVNTLTPRQNGCHLADDIFKCIFLNENAWISLKISLKFVPKVQINNIPALVQIMAWRRPGDKSLSEPMMVSFLTHICITQHQWVNKEWTCIQKALSELNMIWDWWLNAKETKLPCGSRGCKSLLH